MTTATNIVILAWVLIIGVVGVIVYSYRKSTSNPTSLQPSPSEKPAQVIDFQHGFVSRVREVKRRGDRNDVVFDNGLTIPYDEKFKILNPAEVLAGKSAIFVFGASESLIKSGEMMKQYNEMRKELLFEKARGTEIRLREQQTIKEILKRSSGGSED